MPKIHMAGASGRDPLREPTPEELADRLEKDGLELRGIAKLQTEFLERITKMPEMILKDPLSKGAWRQISESLRKERKSVPLDSDLYEDFSIAIATADNMVHGVSLWDAMVHQCDSCIEAYGRSRGVAQGMLRHHGYIVSARYEGRDVG